MLRKMKKRETEKLAKKEEEECSLSLPVSLSSQTGRLGRYRRTAWLRRLGLLRLRRRRRNREERLCSHLLLGQKLPPCAAAAENARKLKIPACYVLLPLCIPACLILPSCGWLTGEEVNQSF